MRELTPRDRRDIELFQKVAGSPIIELDRYLFGEWEWYELWDYNFERARPVHLICKCTFEGLRASARRKGYPKSIRELEKLGFRFSLVQGGGSWHEDAHYECTCGQRWKEVFVEEMLYQGNHAYPMD